MLYKQFFITPEFHVAHFNLIIGASPLCLRGKTLKRKPKTSSSRATNTGFRACLRRPQNAQWLLL